MPAATAVSRLRCLVVDDHPVVRQGIRALLERELPDVEVLSVASPEAALEEVEPGSTDVVVIDLRRVSGEVQETITRLQETLQSPIVVFTADGGSRMLAEALKAGVKGYVRKDSPPEDLVRAIQAARSGEFYVDPALSSSLLLEEGERTLTARQREILQMLADGLHTEEVANKLDLSTETVRTHTKRILSKLGAGTRTQAVAIGIRSGLIE
ncbi:MAG TPA: response regulator transcription factor [Thermoleophilaceae bacterium]